MRGKTSTTTREYDAEGHVVKETTVEVEWPEPVVDSGQWWQNPWPGWWQNPVISYAASSNTVSTDPDLVRQQAKRTRTALADIYRSI